MKLLKDLCKKMNLDETPHIVESQAIIGGFIDIAPCMSDEIRCQVCGGKENYHPFIDPSIGNNKRVWICADGLCSSNSTKGRLRATTIQPAPVRAVLWPLWCEIHGIGDLFHDIKLEKVDQSSKMVSTFIKFALKPAGILILQGTPGNGKTYAALGICEYFTRTSSECIFVSQKSMAVKWLDTFNDKSSYIDKITTTRLLVIDDFGIGEVSPGYMGFFMDLINSRMQWSNRGTIITTNLSPQVLSDYCGNALADRLKTANLVLFKEKSRRKTLTL